MSSLESYYILFSAYFQHSCAVGKYRHTHTGIFFREVAYTYPGSCSRWTLYVVEAMRFSEKLIPTYQTKRCHKSTIWIFTAVGSMLPASSYEVRAGTGHPVVLRTTAKSLFRIPAVRSRSFTRARTVGSKFLSLLNTPVQSNPKKRWHVVRDKVSLAGPTSTTITAASMSGKQNIIYILKIAITVTGREGPYGCETSRLPHFLDNQLADGGEVVSPTGRLPFTPRKIPGTHFC
jgi:hypothetical protein